RARQHRRARLARDPEGRLRACAHAGRPRSDRRETPGDASLSGRALRRRVDDLHRAPGRRDPRDASSGGGHVMDKATALGLYRVMRRIRDFEERATVLFGEGKLWGTIHSYAGEEG